MNASLKRLYARQRHGMKPGLDVEKALLARLGHPEASGAMIHVAGSNGKGSVCAMLSAMLQGLGLKTGLYTSPHLAHFNERFQLNGIPISDRELMVLINEVEQAAVDVARALDKEPTFFECATAIALVWFARNDVEAAVVEVGMGGRLDATNVIEPRVCVVTGVSLEHTAYLGCDLASIAREKAGIVKPNRPFVCGETHSDALQVFSAVARAAHSPMIRPSETVSLRRVAVDVECGQTLTLATDRYDYGRVRLPLNGRHQMQNLAVAVVALEQMMGQTDLGERGMAALARGLAATAWPGRFQLLEREPLVILDGAHNPGAGKVLAATVADTLGDRPVAMIVGLCDDKDMSGFLKCFHGRSRPLWAVPVDNSRSCSPQALAEAAQAQGWEAVTSSLGEAREEARQWARTHDGVVLITGSLYLAGEVLRASGKPWPYAHTGSA